MNRMNFSNYQSMNMVHRTKEGTQLWLGDYYAASNVSLLKSKNIRAVLTSAAMLNINYPKDHGINHKIINAFDIPSYRMTPHFQQAYRFIDNHLKQGNNILVHCAAGISRSTTFVLVFLMRGQNMGFKQALDYVRAKRSIICPNYGFQNQLKRFQTNLRKGKDTEPPQQKTFSNFSEKKVVLDFLNEDKKTPKKEEKMSATLGGSGLKYTNNYTNGLGGTLNDNNGFLRGKSVNYAPRRNQEIPPDRGASKFTKQYLSFKLQTPKIVTIKK